MDIFNGRSLVQLWENIGISNIYLKVEKVT